MDNTGAFDPHWGQSLLQVSNRVPRRLLLVTIPALPRKPRRKLDDPLERRATRGKRYTEPM